MSEVFLLGVALLATAVAIVFLGKRMDFLAAKVFQLNDNVTLARTSLDRCFSTLTTLKTILPLMATADASPNLSSIVSSFLRPRSTPASAPGGAATEVD